MSEQEEYLDRLLNGINEEPEDTEELSSSDESAGEKELLDEGEKFAELEEIDEETFFDGESSAFEDVDPLVLESMKRELNSGLDVTEFGFDEDEFKLDEEDLDFVYEDDMEQEAELAQDNAETESTSDIPTEESFVEGAVEEEVLTEAPIEEAPAEEASTGEEMTEEVAMEEEPENSEPGKAAETSEEIDDAQALANILNAFADEEETENTTEIEDAEYTEEVEDTEEAGEQEAVLDVPEALGLNLEEVEEIEEEEPEEENDKKKKKKKNKEEKSDKKPNLLTRLLEDDADEEPTQEELEAEVAKKAQKEEKKQAKKAAAAEKKQQAKEAAAAKKAEKEAAKKRKAEAEEPPEPWPPFTKKVIPLIMLFGATFVVLIVILSNVLSYSPYLSSARKYFDNRQYEKAYEQLMGIDIKEKDWKFYSQVRLMNQLQVKVTSYENHLLNGERQLALNDLVQAVLFYNEKLERAEELGLQKEFQVVYDEIESGLSEDFGITVDEASQLGTVTDAKEYQKQISEITKDGK